MDVFDSKQSTCVEGCRRRRVWLLWPEKNKPTWTPPTHSKQARTTQGARACSSRKIEQTNIAGLRCCLSVPRQVPRPNCFGFGCSKSAHIAHTVAATSTPLSFAETQRKALDMNQVVSAEWAGPLETIVAMLLRNHAVPQSGSGWHLRRQPNPLLDQ